MNNATTVQKPAPADTASVGVWLHLKRNVIDSGLCTHCGTCVGLSNGTLNMQTTDRGPLPTVSSAAPGSLPQIAYDACPGKGVDFMALNKSIFGADADNRLLGSYRRIGIGYAAEPDIRRNGASGGVITRTLIHLLESGQIDGAVMVRQGTPRPWEAEPIIACKREEILAASQSVYAPIPVNAILDRTAAFDGNLAFVGLPDQVAAIRVLQQAGHASVANIHYVLGPYVGTNMYFAAIESYLRSNGIHRLNEVAELKYRDGEWPGHLMIRTHSGRVLKAEKFYYNYLIPFYLTQSTLYSVDFTNELTDISVGDAWSPRYESEGGGYSVVVARTEAGDRILREMQDAHAVQFDETDLESALSMHGHMLDFKKRGSFIRMDWRAARGLPVPDYGYRPADIPISRKLVEVVIALIFAICGTRPARWIVEQIPIEILGPLFNTLRKSWKSISKPTKRKGMQAVEFIPTNTSTGSTVKMAHAPQDTTAWQRTKEEIQHWLRKDWTFTDVGNHWDSTEDYDDINAETYSYFRRFIDGLRLSSVPDHAHVLDICARTGNGTLYFYEHGRVGSAVCADVSAKMGDICSQRLREGGFDSFTWLQLFDYPLPLPDDEFDAVLFFETIEHFPRPEELVNELARVTKPGGTMILTTPNVLWEPVHAVAAVTGLHHSEGPHRFIPYRRLRRMVKRAGFVITEEETTVLAPGGPASVVSLGEWIEERTRHTLMPLLGLRRVLICRKL